jgi:hypothetical protein
LPNGNFRRDWDTRGMMKFIVIPRGKKYLVQEIRADGSPRIVISFSTEEAAVSCVRELQRQSESRESH